MTWRRILAYAAGGLGWLVAVAAALRCFLEAAPK